MSNQEQKNKKMLKNSVIQKNIQGVKVKFNWNGGHGIHVYFGDKQVDNNIEDDFFNVGNFKNNEASVGEVMEGINNYQKID